MGSENIYDSDEFSFDIYIYIYFDYHGIFTLGCILIRSRERVSCKD